ncbi:hypothetical protein DTL70_07175 [Streptomyces diacarni]|uniref:Protein kinase domain-containing protein n=1 Tax=Streptomyces diacarni TaxID=2800381 RepID=A0A367F8U2_9ACTN|nr:serine/threonine-protein kinase [Streptomyces diacarni]RCG26359.1 hypothetical protein DTL70_07175 [Streptomyces diacarni]
MSGPEHPSGRPEEPGADGPVRVGPYRLMRLLGAGGMGEVHLARSEADGRHVALKLVHPEYAADPQFRARFRQEVDAAGKVLSFFTVPLLDAGPEDPTPWLATQYVPGPSLAQAVRSDGPLATSRLCTLAAALGEALVVIHAAGLVHRDLKPSNVLLADDGPRVIDFGIARAADATGLTGTGMVIGTLGYASPEQLVDEGTLGPASDVYSLGAVLLHAATGRPPFGDVPAAALAYRTVHETPDTTGVPAALLPLVLSCLDHDPARRPTPSQVIAAARTAQSLTPPPDADADAGAAPGKRAGPGDDAEHGVGDSGETTSYPLRPPPPAPVTPTPTAPDHPARPPRWPAARRTVLLALAGAAVLALLVGAGFVLLPGDGDRPGPDDGPSASAEPGKDTPRRAAPDPEGPAADTHADVTAAGRRARVWHTPVTGLPAEKPGASSEGAGKNKDKTTLVGAWLTEHAAARTDRRGTRGFDPGSGRPLWTVEPPRGTDTVCATSLGRSATADGIGAVRYGTSADEDDCTVVSAVDTRTGELLWHHETGPGVTRTPTLGMSGGSLVTAGEDGLLGLDPRTGKERWHRTDRIDGCRFTDALTGPRTVLLLEICGNAPSPDTAVELDSATGEERWRLTLPRNVTHALPVTAEPASVSLGRGGDGSKDALLVLDRTGRHHHEIPKENPFGTLSFAGDEHADRPTVAAHGDTLVLTAESSGAALDDTLVAVDAAGGKVRWHERFAARGPVIVGLDDDSVTALGAYPDPGKPVRLVEYALDDGAVRGDGTLPAAFGAPSDRRAIADDRRVVQFVGRRQDAAAGYAPEES